MLNVRLADDHLSVFLCYPFSYVMSWMRTGVEMTQFLRVFYLIFHLLLITDVTEINQFQSQDNMSLGWSGGAMVLGKLPVPGRPTLWIQ